MSKYRLSTEQMSSISNAWMTEHRASLTALPQVAGIFPDVEDAHNHLVVASKLPLPLEEQVRVISKQQVGVDGQHDRSYRAGLRFIQAANLIAEARGFVPMVKQASEVESAVYHKGASGVLLSYEEEEGAALLLEKKIQESVGLQKALTGFEIKFPNGETISLWQLIEAHITDGKELGVLERQKKKLQEASGDTNATPEGTERKARQSWIEAANLLESNLRAAVRKGSITQQNADAILKPMRDAEEEADKKFADDQKKRRSTDEASTGNNYDNGDTGE
jgi:hypothetical protein